MKRTIRTSKKDNYRNSWPKELKVLKRKIQIQRAMCSCWRHFEKSFKDRRATRLYFYRNGYGNGIVADIKLRATNRLIQKFNLHFDRKAELTEA